MTDSIYERDYAREMLSAAIRRHTGAGRPADAESDSASEITTLVDHAVEAGCSRTQLIVELANLGARLLAQSAADNTPAHAREIVDHVAC